MINAFCGRINGFFNIFSKYDRYEEFSQKYEFCKKIEDKYEFDTEIGTYHRFFFPNR
jgi:hypothetical protein